MDGFCYGKPIEMDDDLGLRPGAAAPRRRDSTQVVLSTNIAEASVTIDDVVYVIDTGVRKERSYDAGGDGESTASPRYVLGMSSEYQWLWRVGCLKMF